MHIELNWDLKKLTQSIRLYWVYTPIDLYTRKFTQLCTIWADKVCNKIKIFIWLACKNILPTKLNLT